MFMDGVMSPLTTCMIRKFGANGVDMTSWWAMTPPGWTCVGCGRRKEEIARLNQNGDLMCRLVEHHDHMRDLLKEEFARISSSQESVVADELAEHFAKRSATMISAYDNAVVCDDCNSVDSKAKKLVGAPKAFSFSPAEIRRFVIATPNRAHALNEELATEIWLAGKATFELRLKIAKRIATIGAKNEHWFQKGTCDSDPETIRSRFRAIADSHQVYGLVDRLCGSKRSSDAVDPASWRNTIHPPATRFPTAGEIAHITRVSHASAWSRVSDDWACPSCRRSKAQTIRMTNRDTWGIALQTIAYRDPNGSRWGKKDILCADCSLTAQHMGKEAAARIGITDARYSILVEVAEVSRVVMPQEHARHRYMDDTELVVEQIANRLKALRSFEK